ncbi:hypothetical protein E3N88_42661 [Mikania micrantha]|uniref:Uncharacterized protein n=1 Tax=Mikania micrantha TaxID=192012 RepID=A0A5N6LH42_9ASTR|nr:hypothetical protein E3N88_42661 [Mikania micrantha]
MLSKVLLYSHSPMFINIFGISHSPQLFILLIKCPLVQTRVSLLLNFFSITNLISLSYSFLGANVLSIFGSTTSIRRIFDPSLVFFLDIAHLIMVIGALIPWAMADRIYIARHVWFNEHCFPFLSSTTQSSPPSFVSSYPTTFTPPAQPHLQQPSQQHSSASIVPSSQQPSLPTKHSSPPRPRPPNLEPHPKPATIFKPISFSTVTSSQDPIQPATFIIANKDLEWRAAMADKYSALMQNGTWPLVPHPPNANIVN